MASPTTAPEVGTPPEPDDSVTRRGAVFLNLTSPSPILALTCVVLFVGFGWVTPAFFSVQFSIYPLLRDASVITVIGLAQLMALSVGHLNLAVGRFAALAALVSGFAFERLDWPLIPGVLAGLVTGALIGALTGWIIIRSKVNAFIVTLAMDFALLGLVTMIYITLTDAAAFTVKPDGMDTIRTGSFADVCLGVVCGPRFLPVMIIPALITVAAIGFIYSRARLGRELLMTGANLQAARLSGIPVNRRIITAHTIGGLLAGLAGVMLAFISGSFSAAVGSQFLLPSFLAPLLGGTSLFGGQVAVIGTLFGTLLTSIIRQGLAIQGFGVETLNIALGIVLLMALSMGRIREAGLNLVRRNRS